MDTLDTGELHPREWRGSVPRSPSRESVHTDLSLFSLSSAASDAKVLKLLACRAGQGPDPNLRALSPNPDGKLLAKGGLSPRGTELTSCGLLCAALGMRRCFSCGDVVERGGKGMEGRNATSEVCLSLALQSALGPPRPQSAAPHSANSPLHDADLTCAPNNNKMIRQSYIKKRLMSTYKALERMTQSEFNLDKFEAAVVAGSTIGQNSLVVPDRLTYNTHIHPEAQLALTAADLERERGRPLSKYERNMMIFNWLHTLDDSGPF